MNSLKEIRKPLFVHYRTSQQILLMRRLALYVGSGISLPRALAYIADSVKSSSVFYILRTLANTVGRGEPLSHGFAKFPRQFDRFTVGFIEAGEASGSLSQTLEYIAQVLEKRQNLTQKVIGSLIYPIVIAIGTFGICCFLTFYIFPKIVPILQGLHTALPFATKILIALSNFGIKNWILIILISISIIFLIFLASLSVQARRYFDYFLIYFPIIGLGYRTYALTIFLRTLSLLLAGGIRIVPALVLVQAALPGNTYPQILEQIEKDVTQGQKLSNALSSHSRLFPSVIVQMVAAGEATGTLQENFNSLAQLYENDLETLIKKLTALIEPALMIFMGIIVGFVALAIITPIYSVTQNLNSHL